MSARAARKDARPRRWFNGYWFTKTDQGYWANEEAAERTLHRFVWSFHHGPLQPGQFVYFKDGDRNNCAIDNLGVRTQRALPSHNVWNRWRAGKCPRPIDHAKKVRLEGLRRFWRSMTPLQREIYCSLRAYAAEDSKREARTRRRYRTRFFQMLAGPQIVP